MEVIGLPPVSIVGIVCAIVIVTAPNSSNTNSFFIGLVSFMLQSY